MVECVVSGCTAEGVWPAIDSGDVASPFDGLVCSPHGESISEFSNGRWSVEAIWCVVVEREWGASRGTRRLTHVEASALLALIPQCGGSFNGDLLHADEWPEWCVVILGSER